jgi:hypothetical protein
MSAAEKQIMGRSRGRHDTDIDEYLLQVRCGREGMYIACRCPTGRP